MPNQGNDITDSELSQAQEGTPSAPDSIEAGSAGDEAAAAIAAAEEAFPRARVEALPLWCTACYGSGCTRCTHVCPTSAITLNEDGPEIDEETCTRCGLCAGICDAFGLANITLADLFARAQRGQKNEGEVCFTCNEHLFPGLQPRNNVVVLPCLGAVPPEFWAACLAEGMKVRIFRDPAYCATCPAAGQVGEGLYAYALDTALAWVGGDVEKVDAIPENADLLTSLARIDTRDRRSLFTSLANESRDVATGKHRKRNSTTTDEYFRKRDVMRAEGRIRAGRVKHRVTPGSTAVLRKYPRLKLLAQAVEARPECAEGISRYVSCTDRDVCDGSRACVTACPTHARRFNEETGMVEVDAQGCIVCGSCVAQCPNGACDLHETTAAIYLDKEI